MHPQIGRTRARVQGQEVLAQSRRTDEGACAAKEYVRRILPNMLGWWPVRIGRHPKKTALSWELYEVVLLKGIMKAVFPAAGLYGVILCSRLLVRIVRGRATRDRAGLREPTVHYQ